MDGSIFHDIAMKNPKYAAATKEQRDIKLSWLLSSLMASFKSERAELGGWSQWTSFSIQEKRTRMVVRLVRLVPTCQCQIDRYELDNECSWQPRSHDQSRDSESRALKRVEVMLSASSTGWLIVTTMIRTAAWAKVSAQRPCNHTKFLEQPFKQIIMGMSFRKLVYWTRDTDVQPISSAQRFLLPRFPDVFRIHVSSIFASCTQHARTLHPLITFRPRIEVKITLIGIILIWGDADLDRYVPAKTSTPNKLISWV